MIAVSSTGAVGGLVAAGIAYLAATTFISYWKLRHIPGPWLAQFSSLWLAYHIWNNNMYLALEEALKKYGSPVRISHDTIVHHDPDFRRYKMAPRSPFIRGDWYEGMKLDPRQHNVLSMQDEKQHSARRAVLKPGYAGKEITTLESDIDIMLLECLQHVQAYAEKDEKFDFASLIAYFMIDMLCKIGFSRVGGFMANNKDQYNYFKTTSEFFPIMELSQHIWFVRVILRSKIVEKLAGPKAGDKAGLGAIMGLACDEVANRFSNEKSHNDMLGSFIRHGLGQESCEVEAVIQILAGSDSTATAIRNTFWHIVSSPRTYRKLNEDISDAIEKGNVSWPVIKEEEAKQLPYLNACIREGIRIFMPLNGIGTMKAPSEGYTLNGVFIPGGTQVGSSNYAMLRRVDIFGPDADTYRPERFLEGDPAKIKRYEQVQELAFGSGRFQCLGQAIALMELRKVVFELFRRFDFSMVDPLRAVHLASNGIVVQRKMYIRAYSKMEK